ARCVIKCFFSSRRRHTRSKRDWSSDVCSSDLFLWLPWSWKISFVRRGVESEATCLSGVRCFRSGVEDPGQHGADGEEDHATPEECLDGHQREQNTDDEGAKGRDSRGPADDAACLMLRENHGRLLEGAGIAQTCEEEHHQHCAEEPPELLWVGGVEEQRRNRSKDGHTETTDKRPDGAAKFVT